MKIPLSTSIGLILLSLFIHYFTTADMNAYAHKVQMFAYTEGEDVFVDGYFADGKKARNSDVIVYDKAGNVLLSGKTDETGQFYFKIPQKTDLRITLNAGMGHQTEYTLRASDLSGVVEKKSSFIKVGSQSKESLPGSDKEEDTGIKTSVQPGVHPGAQIDRAELEAIVEKAVGEAIKPLARNFSEMKDRISLTEIIGGIGYILGIMGIVLYFKARKGS